MSTQTGIYYNYTATNLRREIECAYKRNNFFKTAHSVTAADCVSRAARAMTSAVTSVVEWQPK